MWSFSCSANDLSGHEGGGGEHSKRPHYHFQMFVDGKPFIRYNDFHLPLSEADVGVLEHMRQNPGKVRRLHPGGAGMNDALDEYTLGQHLGRMNPSEEMESALVRFRTNIVAEPGKKISGNDLYDLIQAAKAEGVTAASNMHELKGASVLTLVFPGPRVVRQATRSGRKKSGDRQLRAQDLACTRFRRHRVRCLMELEVGHGETEVYARVQA